MSEKKEGLTIGFYGGVEGVTGANFLLTARGQKILIDCGLFQGSKMFEDRNRERFSYDPAAIDALLVTHAHLDHVGRIPKLVRDGFRGPIYSTPPTKEIAELMLYDSLGVLEKESRSSKVEPFYDERDVSQALTLWQTIEYGEPLTIGALSITARNAGHILGSAMFEIEFAGEKGERIVFTGDLGNSPAPLLPDCEWPERAKYLVMESVYGDRNHETREETREKLEDVIENTMRAGGTLMIPAFSIERTQELLLAIEEMMEESRIPLAPVFLDSPLAIKVTAVYKKYEHYFKQAVAGNRRGAGGIFNFPQLRKTLTTEESKAINRSLDRKIIIAGSGMSNGGRILHHEKRYLPDSNSALLLAGFQAAGSLGRLLAEGARSVTIQGETVPVRARIVTLDGYSAHKGADDLLEFVRRAGDELETVYVTMGEPKSSLALVQRIRDYLGIKAIAPRLGEVLELSFTKNVL